MDFVPGSMPTASRSGSSRTRVVLAGVMTTVSSADVYSSRCHALGGVTRFNWHPRRGYGVTNVQVIDRCEAWKTIMGPGAP